MDLVQSVLSQDSSIEEKHIKAASMEVQETDSR